MSIAAMTAFAKKVISGNTGYDQNERWTFFDRAKKLFVPNREADCSSFCGAVAAMGGYPVDLSGWFYTGNMRQRMTAVGFRAIRFTSLKQLQPGDFVLNEQHHVEYVGPDGRFASASIDENGRATGGKAGNQTGRETRWTNPYIYAKGGWHWILRPSGNPMVPTDYNPGNFPSSYVRNIQTLLAKLGYSVGKSGIDGSLGPDTFNAVKAFQKANGLVVDGVPGPATLAKLNELAAKPAARAADGTAAIAVDGSEGPATIGRLQQVMGTPIDYVLSRPSTVIKALQRFLNKVVGAEHIRNLTGKSQLDVDGYRGPATAKVFQFWSANAFPGHLKNIKGWTLTSANFSQWVDGDWGANTTRMMQAILNDSFAGSGKLGAK